jgi:hypothetical protein
MAATVRFETMPPDETRIAFQFGSASQQSRRLSRGGVDSDVIPIAKSLGPVTVQHQLGLVPNTEEGARAWCSRDRGSDLTSARSAGLDQIGFHSS